MDLREGLAMGLLEIRTHKLRSLLSFLGVLVGVASVMLTLAFLEGSREKLRRGLELSGPGRLEIERQGGSGDIPNVGSKETLTWDDARAIRREFPKLALVSPEDTAYGRVAFEDSRFDSGVVGVTPAFAERDWVYSVRGRFFNEHDVQAFAKVCVVVQKAAPGRDSYWADYYSDWTREPLDRVLSRYDVLGKDIEINGTLFHIVGVLRPPDEDDDPRLMTWGDWGRRIMLPLSTMQEYFSGSGDVQDIQVDTGGQQSVPYYTGAIMRLLAARHRHARESFVIRNRAELMEQSMEEARKLRYVFMGVGIISLIAGGIGIMNVTLAIVFSRIREIGIRRAVGATRLDILLQFVLESCLLSLLGGLAGVALGIAGVWVVPHFWSGFDAVTTPWAIAICLLISVGVGLFFSLYPAWQASRLDPVEALRYE